MIRSSGATRAWSATGCAHRAQQQLAGLGDAAPDDDAVGREEDEDVRDREPDQLTGARERAERGIVAEAARVTTSSNDGAPAAAAIARAPA